MDRKYIVSVIAFLFITFVSCAQNIQDRFYIKGDYTGDNAKYITLSYRISNEKCIVDTCKIIDRKFSFTGNIKEPTIAILEGKNISGSVDDPNFTYIFIEPTNMKMNVEENHFKSLKLYGSVTQNQYDSLHKVDLPIRIQMAPLDSEDHKLGDSIGFFLKRKDTVSAIRIAKMRDNVIHTEMKPYVKEQNNIERNFIKKNPNSYLASYLLNRQFLIYKWNKDSVSFCFNSFTPNVQNSFDGKNIKKWLNGIISISSVFPDIIGVNNKEEKTSIHSLLENDYSLIIFWASWCIPCRKLNPIYHKIFDEYNKKGLKFIAVTLDTDKKKWLDAIEKDNTSNWEHIYSNKTSLDFLNNYGISSIPAEYLLKGKSVVAKYAGADNEETDVNDLQNKLKEIFKDK